MYEEDIILYLLKECGGLHPFHISRLIALLDLFYLKEKGEKITTFKYQKMPFGFYIEKLPDILKNMPLEKIEEDGYKYLKIRDDAKVKINMPYEVRRRIDKILDEVCDLSDSELNAKVLIAEYYSKL